MKNAERQKSLDKQKWLESEKENADMSGAMDYCDFCACQTIDRDCAMKPNERVSTCRCATAYNTMVSRNSAMGKKGKKTLRK
jgi:hypothetical protein